jgi:hypothetical protein
VTEFEQRLRRILRLEAALVSLGAILFGLLGSMESAGAFLAAGLLSLTSLIVLGAAARAVGGGRFSWFLGLLFVTRLLLYALAFSAILKVYPNRDTELATGLLASVAAILIEAIFTTNQDART